MRRASKKPSAWRLPCAFLLVAVLVGCGDGGMPPLYQVTGKLTIDGKPVPDATVTFQPITTSETQFARPSVCISGADGTIEPWTMVPGDGLPEGRYRVGVQARTQTSGPPMTERTTSAEYARMKFDWIVPKQYLDASTSGIEVTVTPDGMEPEVIALTSE